MKRYFIAILRLRKPRRPRCGGGDATSHRAAPMRRGPNGRRGLGRRGSPFESLERSRAAAPLEVVQDVRRQKVELSSPRPRLSLKVAWFLTDVPTAEHGALRLVPGSHTRDALPRDREPPGAVPLLVRAGTAVVLDRRLWHTRGDNCS